MAIGVHVMAMQRKTSISDLEKEHAYLESWRVDRKLNYKIKTRLYNTLVMPTATYSCENWKSSVKINRRIDEFHNKYLRKILNTACITYLDNVTSGEIIRTTKQK